MVAPVGASCLPAGKNKKSSKRLKISPMTSLGGKLNSGMLGFFGQNDFITFFYIFFSVGLTVGLTTAAGLCLVDSNKAVKTLL